MLIKKGGAYLIVLVYFVGVLLKNIAPSIIKKLKESYCIPN